MLNMTGYKRQLYREWSLIFDDIPGKTKFVAAIQNSTPIRLLSPPSYGINNALIVDMEGILTPHA
jgi:hypothetical protein